ncbi:hypothetical protein UFOVP681_31 [uncultured Caudovirales phage]|uniref:Uncharacterized protein n=1 Tax=uncultured Caudovirales phage TaxID=2100421 RepID=A0A6J5NL17_9CAUD|nr:hypothetical protein UFOVP681_31 [uncultured Caudovirales phage]
MTLDQFLRDMGLAPAKPAPQPVVQRPAGKPCEWRGEWYPDGVVPH